MASFKGWMKKIVIIFRIFISLLVIVQILVHLDYFSSSDTLGWYWIAYVVVSYLVFFELPLFIFRHKQKQREFFIPIAFFAIPLYFFDAIGNIFNLFQRTRFYDDALHFTTVPWAAVALMTGLIVWLCDRKKMYDKTIIISMMVTFAVSFLVFHEIIEYLIDLVSGTTQGTATMDVYDTVRDLMQGVIGIVLFFVLRLHYLSAYRLLPIRQLECNKK